MAGETTTRDETTSELRTTPPRRYAVWARRVGTGVLLLIVVLAGLDLLGPRTGETSAAAGGYELRAEFPQVTRAGQPAPLRITVEALAGFGDTVQLRLCDELFHDLDFQNWYPNPAAETSQPPWVIYEFDPPPTGDVLEISLDARVAPGQFGAIDDCGLSVLVDDQPVVGASFTVWRMP
ncbi:hypothetical protein [Nocardioides allogilvus]|uniref:hypothetical protein n=1 Tax=Nocardioides allogilvus TaxID=2072017 RepID=UPI0013007F76|nr:hypothetical protein [Nocardioides allogilvus]